MERIEYAATHMKILSRLAKRREKIRLALENDGSLTDRKISSLRADLTLISMHIEQEKERIGYALGYLSLNDLREEWQPTGFHTYRGLRMELEGLPF